MTDISLGFYLILFTLAVVVAIILVGGRGKKKQLPPVQEEKPLPQKRKVDAVVLRVEENEDRDEHDEAFVYYVNVDVPKSSDEADLVEATVKRATEQDTDDGYDYAMGYILQLPNGNLVEVQSDKKFAAGDVVLYDLDAERIIRVFKGVTEVYSDWHYRVGDKVRVDLEEKQISGIVELAQ
jgi:hypothetical protein